MARQLTHDERKAIRSVQARNDPAAYSGHGKPTQSKPKPITMPKLPTPKEPKP